MSTIWADEAPGAEGSPAADEGWPALVPSGESPFGPPHEHEVIGPTDDRGMVSDADVLTAPSRWVCSLDVTFQPEPGSKARPTLRRGSGLLIGPRHVLTAAHNLYLDDGRGRPATVSVIPGRCGRREPFGRIKGVGWTVPGRALEGRGPAGNREHDYGMVVLERDIANARFAAIGGQAFGHWGSPTLGHRTVLQALSRTFLTGKPVVSCGYPGDRCGTARLDLADPRARCDARDQATTLWRSNGTASWWSLPGLVCHSADTAPGQSGSPLWILFGDGRRFLVGVHVDAGAVERDAQGRAVRRLNRAVHINDNVLAMLRAWMR